MAALAVAARPALDDDLSELVRLATLAGTEVGSARGGAMHLRREARAGEGLHEQYRSALGDLTQLVLVGTIDAAVVGYVVCHLEPLRDATRLCVIADLYVEPEGRGVGVGEELLDAVMAWAREHRCIGVDAIALPGNREQKNFFERFGLTARAILVHRSLVEEPDGSVT